MIAGRYGFHQQRTVPQHKNDRGGSAIASVDLVIQYIDDESNVLRLPQLLKKVTDPCSPVIPVYLLLKSRKL